MFSTNKKEKSIKIDNFWRHRILSTCGDANVKQGREKRLSRTLPLSQCQIHMYNRQQTLSETVPQGNRTMCCFRSVKVKQNAISLRTRVFHGRKVTTINADDMEYIVEYIKCEVIDNTSHIKKMKRE
jgi:hypothetical protein